MTDSSESLPTDLATAHAMILAERAARVEAEALAANAQSAAARAKAEVANARADLSSTEALIGRLKLEIAKLERQVYGPRSERSARLIDQLALEFEELEADATEDELAAEEAVAKTSPSVGFTRKRPERNTFPDHLPRERVVIPATAMRLLRRHGCASWAKT